jgi:A118 family predicted phage portal protein
MGGIILKPNGTYSPDGAVDYVMPGSFAVTEKNSNGDILGVIFLDRITKGSDYYTRLEYQHFTDTSFRNEDGTDTTDRVYVIENKAYKSNNRDSLGRSIQLTDVPEWAGIDPVITITNVEKPLFAYLRMPGNNTADYESPEGVSIFSNCIEELRNLDIAWSMKSNEVEDSKHITFIDENRISRPDPKNRGTKKRFKLPRFVQGIKQGVDAGETIHEHVATLLTGDRIADINSILSMISTKAGFSQGQFVLDRNSGQVTATQIESDDNETIETIQDVRTALMAAVKSLVYALDKYCDIFHEMPSGYVNALDEDVADEDIFYFRDLLSTFEQDRARAYQLVIQGIYSKKKYLMEYEGFSEEEALAMLEEAKAENEGGGDERLFGGSENGD